MKKFIVATPVAGIAIACSCYFGTGLVSGDVSLSLDTANNSDFFLSSSSFSDSKAKDAADNIVFFYLNSNVMNGKEFIIFKLKEEVVKDIKNSVSFYKVQYGNVGRILIIYKTAESCFYSGSSESTGITRFISYTLEGFIKDEFKDKQTCSVLNLNNISGSKHN